MANNLPPPPGCQSLRQISEVQHEFNVDYASRRSVDDTIPLEKYVEFDPPSKKDMIMVNFGNVDKLPLLEDCYSWECRILDR